MADQFFDARPGRPEIFSRIEFLRVVREGFADACSHGEAKVCIYVYLGATNAAGDLYVCLRHASGIGSELATVFVDFLDEVLRHAGGPVEHQGIVAKSGFQQCFLYRFEPLQIEVLFTLELVCPMRVANRYSKESTPDFLTKSTACSGLV